MGNARFKTVKRVADKTLSSRIVDGYKPAEGCPPLSTHWGGAPLSEGPWLKQFADSVATHPQTAEAWRRLEKKLRNDDLCFLIELLYLFTFRKDTSVDKSHDSYRVLKVALDSIVPAYDDLIEQFSAMIESSDAKQTPFYGSFDEDLRSLAACRKHAEKVRNEAAFYGTNKTNPRDWYLHLMVVTMEAETRKHQIPTLLDLLNAAWAANGERTGLLDEGTLRKRVQRYRKRRGLDKSPPPLPSRLFDDKGPVDPALYLDAQELLDLQKEYEAQEQYAREQFESKVPFEEKDIPF